MKQFNDTNVLLLRFGNNGLTPSDKFHKFAAQGQKPVMAKPTRVQEAVKTITKIGGWAYKDPTYNYDWIIVCPRILGRVQYNCHDDKALIAWADKYSQPKK